MPKLQGRPRILSSHLIIFLLVFAAVGGVVLLLSHAAPNPNLQGDLNNDNVVNSADLAIMIANFGTNFAGADINQDGTVNGADFSALLANYGRSVSGGGGTCSAAAFPSRLKTSGRNLVDENGCVMPPIKGFSAQVVPWSQGDFNAIAAKGAKMIRTVVFWDSIEPTQGNISSSYIAALDTHIARLQAAGLYTELELHMNVSSHWPTWAGPMNMSDYILHGQNVTQYLANRYGNPASPQYTKAVMGFGLNEPVVDNPNDVNVIPNIESQQRTMISWFRGGGNASNWIGFVAYGYAQATPLYNLACAAENGKQGTAFVNADPHAYDSVGGNVIIDLHDYATGTTTATPNFDGRQYNGETYPDYQGGTLTGTGGSGASAYTPSNRALTQSQLAGYVCPYKTFSQQASIPLMVGEWGWTVGPSTTSLDEGSGGVNYITDQKAVWDDAGAAIQLQWDYNTNQVQNNWSARPTINGVPTWQSTTTAWLGQ